MLQGCIAETNARARSSHMPTLSADIQTVTLILPARRNSHKRGGGQLKVSVVLIFKTRANLNAVTSQLEFSTGELMAMQMQGRWNAATVG